MVDRDAALHHDAATTEPVTLSNVNVSEALPRTFVDTNPTVVELDTEPGFISEHHLTPLNTLPPQMKRAPMTSGRSMTWWSNSLATAADIIGSQTIAYGLIRHSSSSRSPQIVT